MRSKSKKLVISKHRFIFCIEIFSFIIFGILNIWGNFQFYEDYTLLSVKYDKFIIFGLSILFGTAGIVCMLIKESRKDAEYKRIIREKEKIIEQQEGAAFDMLRKALKINLKEISSRLKFKQAQRICVYQYFRERKEFMCVGRYSMHFVHSDYSTRNYPDNMGIISHVWAKSEYNGYKRDNNFPDYDEGSPEAYYKYIKEQYNIPQYASKKFRMKSVDMIAATIYTIRRDPVAVIVFESEKRGVLDEVRIGEILTDESKNLIISSLLEIPTLNDR